MTDRDLEKQYDQDLRDLVDTYRTLKNLGKWLAALFAFALVVTSLFLALKK